MRGIDYGFGKVPGKIIADAGYQFVGRYLSYNSAKNLNINEVADFHANDLRVIVVWETTTRRCMEGMDAGRQDSQSALTRLEGLGFTNGVIYFACDDDFQEDDMATIESYFKGVGMILPLGRIGVYGGYATVKQMFDSGLVKYGWQTYAWSHGAWDERAQVRQIDIYGPQLDGVDCDTDQTVQDDFGAII